VTELGDDELRNLYVTNGYECNLINKDEMCLLYKYLPSAMEESTAYLLTAIFMNKY
jgi:hypothetical protein